MRGRESKNGNNLYAMPAKNLCTSAIRNFFLPNKFVNSKLEILSNRLPHSNVGFILKHPTIKSKSLLKEG